MPWYPNRAQWFAIWVTTVIVLILCVGSADDEDEGERLALSVGIVGALVVWMPARPKAPRG
jgi:hypothetical protein